MKDVNVIHIYRCAIPRRTRALCPYHHHLCYGDLQDFYDTSRPFFDCGTMVDYGYGEYTMPTFYKKITIFKDGDGFTVRACYADKFLAIQVPLPKAKAVARTRLKKAGVIQCKM